jgi:hypothetical protein
VYFHYGKRGKQIIVYASRPTKRTIKDDPSAFFDPEMLFDGLQEPAVSIGYDQA